MDPSKGEMFWEVLSTITIGDLPKRKMPMDRFFTYYRHSDAVPLRWMRKFL
jgi:hypothetical protein